MQKYPNLRFRGIVSGNMLGVEDLCTAQFYVSALVLGFLVLGALICNQNWVLYESFAKSIVSTIPFVTFALILIWYIAYFYEKAVGLSMKIWFYFNILISPVARFFRFPLPSVSYFCIILSKLFFTNPEHVAFLVKNLSVQIAMAARQIRCKQILVNRIHYIFPLPSSFEYDLI
ncbi:MAG: hypothetical protein H6662_00235 [Ardenticatenaceae bacterium]|nr:hypothetical protein [Anaerolineales bacterium]MCB8919983.1 hypothetical protein [Ardenticatenaceae bacterium]MCB8989830.1 hypothetical protein [Ardenticatenaceae bacterium]